jgi:2-iminobutanoate/2-iminopropanoate deaminase
LGIKTVATDNAPQAIGPYSQAIIANGMIFTSGQVPLNTNGLIVGPTIEEQTHQVLKNLSAVLEAAGSSLQHVVKTSIFLSDMNDFKTVNEIYAEYFGGHRPARSTVAVKTLPLNVKIEIDCVAMPDPMMTNHTFA